MANRDQLPTERIATAAWMFAKGREITVSQLAEHLSISNRGARVMLHKLSLALPIYSDDDGVWRVLEDIDTGY